jgi:metal-dependent HD superfamily phosphatase/phosphodiesterase
MRNAKFVTEISIIDPDSKEPVDIEVYKHPNGGIFAIDSSYLEQNYDDDVNPNITDPFDVEGGEIRLTVDECNF